MVLLFYLYAGFLSYTCAEVFAGTSPFGILNPGQFLLAYPLYTIHIIFLAGVARHINRTSIASLYLFGVLFGLYETWITKVAWTGYSMDGFVVGQILGFGIHESIGLILFYHPLASFLIPLTALSVIFPNMQKTFPEPDWLFGKGKKRKFILVAFIMFFASISAHNLGQPFRVVTAWSPSIIICIIGGILLTKKQKLHDIDYFNFSLSTLKKLGFLLFVLYIVSFVLFFKEEVEWYVYIINLSIYYWIIKSIKHKKIANTNIKEVHIVKIRTVIASFLAIFFLSLLLSFFIGILNNGFVNSIVLLIMLSSIPAGLFSFIYWGISKAK